MKEYYDEEKSRVFSHLGMNEKKGREKGNIYFLGVFLGGENKDWLWKDCLSKIWIEIDQKLQDFEQVVYTP